jgi:excisionase family DNA binding protein
MEVNQSYPNLLSEKQAASRLGIARITLLRAREAGRIRFFRIGTRVLYSEAQLIEFLNDCEQNGRGGNHNAPARQVTRRKDNQVSAPGKQHSAISAKGDNSSRKNVEVDQVSLPFSAAS